MSDWDCKYWQTAIPPKNLTSKDVEIKFELSNGVWGIYAYDGELEVSQAYLTKYTKDKYPYSDHWYLWSFIVIPHYRSKGIGTRILKLIKGMIRESDNKICELLSSSKAIPLYKRMGFQPKYENSCNLKLIEL